MLEKDKEEVFYILSVHVHGRGSFGALVNYK